MIIKDRTDLDPVGRKMYSVEYEGSNYWVHPVGKVNYWIVIKDDSDNEQYNTYHIRERNKFSCTCNGSMHKTSCRHITIVREVIKYAKVC